MKIDLAKRRRIMQRSIELGHCVCDPKRPCPCDVFKDQGICLCAGERPEPGDIADVKLTEMVHNAGCASKIAAVDLEAVLARLPEVSSPAVISGIPAGDDAGVYDLGDGVVLVQTVDVFTPCVDDPELFGRICAANCLSDIYAMGAQPHTALSILGFPAETQNPEIMYRMLKGAMDTLEEASVALLGGHSIKDEEIKLGFAITGTAQRDAIERGNAKVGDKLVLTKSLGVGALNFARQIGRIDASAMRQAEASMATLNKSAAEAMVAADASACTDVTGFGLFGHLIGMARHSGLTACIQADTLPAFDGALEVLGDGVVPGAVERNREYVGEDISIADNIDDAVVCLGFDAQTSGGLLIAICPERCDTLLSELDCRGVGHVTIGEFTAESTGRIVLAGEFKGDGEIHPKAAQRDSRGQSADDSAQEDAPCCGPDSPEPCCPEATSEPCCPDMASEPCCPDPTADSCCPDQSAAPADLGEGMGTSAHAAQAFGMLMRVTASGGAIDAHSKELINFALAVASRCAPCVRAHYTKAINMGISREQLDEAAWCAVAMGGGPVKMFYQDMLCDLSGGNGGCCS
ncbi:MAG: selenide, water dikinase SelD [Phycisphaerae bacterium]|jgi:selenide,water dikinase|nr:selenide, water dikinase SelD [Phycisphaerae bacterium]